MTNQRWTIWTSIYLFEWCFYSWQSHLFPHLKGFTDPERMEKLFWYYLNYGNQGCEDNLL